MSNSDTDVNVNVKSSLTKAFVRKMKDEPLATWLLVALLSGLVWAIPKAAQIIANEQDATRLDFKESLKMVVENCTKEHKENRIYHREVIELLSKRVSTASPSRTVPKPSEG